jgi:hypothetical protein
MTNFLDYRASVNAPGIGLINTEMSTSLNSLSCIASIGLIVGNATNMRVHLQGQIGVWSDYPIIDPTGTIPDYPADVYIYIYRCVDPFNVNIPSGDQIYYAAHLSLIYGLISTLTFSIADFPPKNIFGQLTYSLFAHYNGAYGHVGACRRGPESFEGFVVTADPI